jgi:hypothetical protein
MTNDDLPFASLFSLKYNGESMRLEERKTDLLKEIDLIQAIINRMAQTSFIIKGWAITMITMIFAYKSSTEMLVLVIIPIILFWLLDAYFLQRERLYRKLYEWVIENRMINNSYLFSLNTNRFKHEVGSILGVMFSITLSSFYGMALILNIIYYLLLNSNNLTPC